MNMTQEENLKQLLLKDLCARLPYGVKCCARYNTGSRYNTNIITIIPENGTIVTKQNELHYQQTSLIEDCRPYLRPMSSMTEEELKELNEKYGSIAYFFIQEPPYYHGLQAQHSDIGSIEISEFSEIYDWLNAHHFDYRIDPSTGKTLIESNLAIKAPEGMYKTE